MNSVFDVVKLSCSLEKAGKPLSIVHEVSFSLFPGKTLALVGESGSGKSTTALALLRLLSSSNRFLLEGDVLFQGVNLLKLSEKELSSIRGGKIAMIFQDPQSSLNPVFTVGDQIAEMAEIHLKCTPEEAEERTFRILEAVEMPNALRAFEIYPHELSGGMKQRAMIAMALVANPSILIADEPTTALDATIQKEVLELLKTLQHERKMAMLLITHDMNVAAYMADEVGVMYAGEIVEFGKTHDVFEKKLHPYTQALFHARPTREMRKKPLTVIKGVAPVAGQRPSGCPFHPRCPQVMPKCHEGLVPTFRRGENHWAKCWTLE